MTGSCRSEFSLTSGLATVEESLYGEEPDDTTTAEPDTELPKSLQDIPLIKQTVRKV